MTEVQ